MEEQIAKLEYQLQQLQEKIAKLEEEFHRRLWELEQEK